MENPGCFIQYEGKSGETTNWNSSYTDVLIPVLHHGAIASGVDKCDLCRFHLEGSCQRGLRPLMLTAGVKDQNGFVPFAPSRMSLNVVGAYTPVYHVGIYSVADGHTVHAEFLDSIT